jgi:hypothetical protein
LICKDIVLEKKGENVVLNAKEVCLHHHHPEFMVMGFKVNAVASFQTSISLKEKETILNTSWRRIKTAHSSWKKRWRFHGLHKQFEMVKNFDSVTY